MIVTACGFLVADIIAADLSRLARPSELIFAPRGIQLHVGGHPANVSMNLRQLGLPEGEVSVVGAIGQDIFGDFIEKTLRNSGVVTHLERVSQVGTTKNVILILKKEDRRFHVDLGASWNLDPNHVKDIIEREKPYLFYVATGIEGKFDEQLPDVLKKAKDYNCLTFVNIVTPYGKGWDFIIPAFKSTDIFHCNNMELLRITKGKELSEAMEIIMRLGVKMIIVSLGSKGVVAKTKRVRLVRQEAFNVPVVDPTGAGDAFCAGTIYELTQEKNKKLLGENKDITALPLEQLLKILLLGQAAGAACVTAVGTTAAVTSTNVQQLIKEQGTRILSRTKMIM